MSPKRYAYRLRNWAIFRLDQFVATSPLLQLPALAILTLVTVFVFAAAFEAVTGHADSAWWVLTRFMDGGTMAADQVMVDRVVAVFVSVSGILVIALLIGAVSSKLSERIGVLRLGRSPVAVRSHVLVLGFDAKVPLIARELALSGERVALVTLSSEEKARQELWLRPALHLRGSRLRTVVRSGDPRSELDLLRVAADRARTILVVPPSGYSDDAATRWTLAVLLALRRVTTPDFAGRVVCEVRRTAQVETLRLAAEAGLVEDRPFPIELVASDDIFARVLAQSVRHGAVYLALRELISFQGSELYLEPVPRALIGRTFEEAHAAIERAILVGVQTESGVTDLAPDLARATRPLADGDRLVVLATGAGRTRARGRLPAAPPPPSAADLAPSAPTTIGVLGFNRTLPRLLAELERILPSGSRVVLSAPELPAGEERAVRAELARARRVAFERAIVPAEDVGRPGDPALAGADGIVILGCEDEQDPEGDLSAIQLLLELRAARRAGEDAWIRRLITEVRDPEAARQIAGTLDDFLVSTDVVAMLLAHAAYDLRLLPIYRELLDPEGAELLVRPRASFVPHGPARFDEVMAAARRRGELAIGFFPHDVAPRADVCVRDRVELGLEVFDEQSFVRLNPPRDAELPAQASVIVMTNLARERREAATS